MNDFYFVYYPVGPQFIKTMMVTFQYVPKEVNIVVMTPTPELLKDVKVNFNLIVINSDDIIDDFSRQNEPTIKETDDVLYIEKLKENYKNHIRFSASTHRYIIPWLIERNISKFAILDTDCLINYSGEFQDVFNHMKNTYDNKNLLFGPIMHWSIENKMHTLNKIKKVFDDENIDWTFIENMSNPTNVFDGWLRGFWFQDADLLKKYYNLWDNSIKKFYENSPEAFDGNSWTVPDEWITAVITYIFNKQYNVVVEDALFAGMRIAKHIYHPENDFFSLHHEYLYKTMYNLKEASSRHEFYIKNKDALIKFYSDQNGIIPEKMKEVIFDYEK